MPSLLLLRFASTHRAQVSALRSKREPVRRDGESPPTGHEASAIDVTGFTSVTARLPDVPYLFYANKRGTARFAQAGLGRR